MKFASTPEVKAALARLRPLRDFDTLLAHYKSRRAALAARLINAAADVDFRQLQGRLQEIDEFIASIEEAR